MDPRWIAAGSGNVEDASYGDFRSIESQEVQCDSGPDHTRWIPCTPARRSWHVVEGEVQQSPVLPGGHGDLRPYDLLTCNLVLVA